MWQVMYRKVATDISQLARALFSGSVSLVSILILVYTFLANIINRIRKTQDPSAYIFLSKMIVAVMVFVYLSSLLCMVILYNNTDIILKSKNPELNSTLLFVAAFLYSISMATIISSIYYVSCKEIW